MNNTIQFQHEGSNTTRFVSTQIPIRPTSTSPLHYDQPEKNIICNTESNEGFLPMSPAFLLDQQLCYTDPTTQHNGIEKTLSNLKSFNMDISEPQQSTTENQLDGFLLHQLTQNDMDILLSLSLVPESDTIDDNGAILNSTNDYPLKYFQSNPEVVEKELNHNEFYSKDIFQQQDSSTYFDQIFLQNISKALIESKIDPESYTNPSKIQQGNHEEDLSFGFLSEAETNDSNQEENRPRICLWENCGEIFIDLQALISHLSEIHMGKGKATYCCQWEGCPRIDNPFTKRHKMYAHLRIHTGERPFACPEPGCKKQFTRPDSLNNHIKTHSKIKTFVCKWEGCKKAYFYSRSLKKHEGTHMSSLEQSKYQNLPTKLDPQTQSQPNILPENVNPLFVPKSRGIFK